MEYFPALLSRAESYAAIVRIEAHFERFGFGLWAAELRESEELIGFIGLSVPGFKAAFTPCVEIGWRLAREQWGRGLATEGARAVAHHAFEELRLQALVSFTAPANARSRRVMEKLGMVRNVMEDFDHPHLPDGHSLKRHVLYRLSRGEWEIKGATRKASVEP
jgi:RimJ/RimL family protein N-acetyltransferase